MHSKINYFENWKMSSDFSREGICLVFTLIYFLNCRLPIICRENPIFYSNQARNCIFFYMASNFNFRKVFTHSMLCREWTYSNTDMQMNGLKLTVSRGELILVENI